MGYMRAMLSYFSNVLHLLLIVLHYYCRKLCIIF